MNRDPYDYGHPDYGKEEDMGDLRLSEAHGVNPGMEQCYYCLEAKGVILWGRISAKQADALIEAKIPVRGGNSAGGDVEAPRMVCLNKEPCSKCQGYMEQGIILISVRDEEENENPFRTGRFCVVKEDLIKRWPIDENVRDNILDHRSAFLPDTVWDMLGLPAKESG